MDYLYAPIHELRIQYHEIKEKVIALLIANKQENQEKIETLLSNLREIHAELEKRDNF